MTVNINAANITSIRLAEQGTDPGTPASGFASLFVDTNGDLATVKNNTGGIKIATSPASGDYTLTVDGTGTAARLNASNVFTSAQVMPAGTVGAPALTTTGDTNTGIYFPGADRMAFTTGGVIRGSWTTSGLCFGTDTAAVNALGDYEEGTWTPDIRSSSGAGTATYSEAIGTYTKIGRLVQASALVSWSGHSISSGNLRMGNFPFNPSSSDNMASIGYFHNVALAANNVVTGFIPNASNQIFFYQYPVGGGAASLVAMDTAGSIYVTITYTV